MSRDASVGVNEEDLDGMLADVAGVGLDARDERGLQLDGRLVAPHVRDPGAEHRDGAVGMGGGSFSVGREQSSSNKISSFSCQINPGSFDEAAFVGSLKADVEQEINRSGATIVNRGSSDPAGFYFEYSEGDLNGRISIEGKSGTNYYSLEASLDEKSEAKSK